MIAIGDNGPGAVRFGPLRPYWLQLGQLSPAGLLLMFVSPVPSSLMIKISELPFRSAENTMRRPSGDHAGEFSEYGLDVRRVSPDPSAFIR